MNKPLLIAAGVSVFTCFVHVVFGGPEIHNAILASNASDGVKGVGSVIWHAISAILILNAGALAYSARNAEANKAVVWLVVVQYLAFVALFLGYGIARFGSIFVLPQWTLFLIMSLLAIWGVGYFRKQPISQ